jgi:P4 family phage/plasmid primase-like protien
MTDKLSHEFSEQELRYLEQYSTMQFDMENEFSKLLNQHQQGLPVDMNRLEELAWNVLRDDDMVQDLLMSIEYSPKRKTNQRVNPEIYFPGRKFNPVALGRDIINNHLSMFCDGQSLYCYDHGVYLPNGGTQFERLAAHLLGDEWKSRYVSEALEWVRQTLTPPSHTSVNPNDGLINVRNGLVDWRTGELKEHTPKRLSTIQLPVMYDPQANDPIVLDFMKNVMPEDTLDTVFEMIGYCLVTHTDFEKAIMLIGSGGNGKSTFINMLSALIGQQNISNISLQDLESNRFKMAELQNKLVNTFADLPRTSMSNSSNFKAIVSGDSVNAERKYKDPFDFRPFAKLVFSTNEFPKSADMTDGYFRRWLIIPFEKTFTPDKADVNLIEKLTTPSALSTLLNYALEGLRRLDTNGKFTESETISRAVEQYRNGNDKVALFVKECCSVAESESCLSKVLYDAFKNWCEASGLKPFGKPTFNKNLENKFGVSKKRRKGDSCERWFGIGLKG